MLWNLKLPGREVPLTLIETAVAVRPDAKLRARSRPSEMVHLFGTAAQDDVEGGAFGLNLPSRNRRIFEEAGWLFVEPTAAVASAAKVRLSIPGTEAVREVVIGSDGELMIVTDFVAVQLASDLPEEVAKKQLKDDGLRLVRRLRCASNTFEARLPTRRPVSEITSELQEKTERYRFVEPALLQVITGRCRPTDLEYHKQWQHHNDGSNEGKEGADIRSEEAWKVTRGAGVRIAVIDTAMQIDHPEFEGAIVGGGYFKRNAQGGTTFVRFKPGITGFPSDHHGTFCMGMAGARMNNKEGGCGSAPEAGLVPIACLEDKISDQITLARAVTYAAEHAEIISCSLSANAATWKLLPTLKQAIEFAGTQRFGRGVPIFWSVSNGNFRIDGDEVCSHPYVIAVGMSNRCDLRGDSAFGPKLEFLAPGVGVFSTYALSQNNFGTGASYATPLAAGVGALVLSLDKNLTAEQIRQRLRASCDKIGAVAYHNGRNDEYGFGRINAERAVKG